MNKLKLVKLKNPGDKTTFTVGGITVGKDFLNIAGPCSIENEQQTIEIAIAVKAAGANILRGGAFKPRTSPYNFQGLGLEGLKILEKAKNITGLPVVTEVMDPRDVNITCQYVDILQIGTRNILNYPLLREVGKTGKPVLLKRGMHSTLKEWLCSAEYILAEGNQKVILCERGIKTLETYTRNTLDLSIIPAVHEVSHLPVIVDPSHGTGRASLIEKMCLAAVAAGAEGLMLEVHPTPEAAKCDRSQQLTIQEYRKVIGQSIKLKEYLDTLYPNFDGMTELTSRPTSLQIKGF